MKKRKELKRDKVAGTPAGIRESLKKATTEMLVLFLLERKPMYTYEMMQTIKLMSDGKISLTNLYIAIYRLEDFQFIRKDFEELSDENRTRIYFSITENGRLYLRRLIDEYREFTQAVDSENPIPLTPFRMRNALWPSARGRSLFFQPYNRPFRPNTAITSSRFMGRSGLVPSTTPSAVAFAQ